MGYHRAGFQVVGVDSKPQPRYPFTFVQADALEFLRNEGIRYSAIAASPPCFDHTALAAMTGGDGSGWMLAAVRDQLRLLGRPYVIENVPGAPMPGALRLCGSEFCVRAVDHDGQMVQLRRHRYFESNIFLLGAGGCQHDPRLPVAGVYGGNNNGPKRGRSCGYVPRVDIRRQLMGIDWMSRREINLAIPPAYTEHIGHQILAAIREGAA